MRAPFLALLWRDTKIRRNSPFAVGNVREPSPHSWHLQMPHFRDPRIEKPLTIFASRVVPDSKSLRPQHTVEPLAELIGREKVRLDFSEGKEEQLVAAAVAVDGVVLISWHHEAIPAIKTSSWATTLHPEIGIKS